MIVRCIKSSFALAALLLSLPVWALQMEAGEATVNGNSWVTVTFGTPFEQTPVVVGLTESKGSEPGSVRIRNVTPTGFQMGVLEPVGTNGSYPTFAIPYLAVEVGTHTLPNGDRVQAGTVSTFQQQRGYNAVLPLTGWTGVNFPSAFPSQAVVVATLQTVNNEPAATPGTPSQPFLTVAIDAVTNSGFNVALERSSWSDGGNFVVAETVGWVAMAAGTFGSFTDDDGNTIQYETFNTGNNVQGWDDGCYNRPLTGFVNTYSSPPFLVASQNTRDGADGGWVRQCDISTTDVGFTIDDTPTPNGRRTERVHTTEEVGVIVFEAAFVKNTTVAEARLQKTVLVDNDPFNGTVNPKAIPGAEVIYTIRAENTGSETLSNVSLEDPVPNQLDLYVANTENCGPANFSEGGAFGDSGLDCTAAVISYDDGSGNYTYTPSPDVDGYDPAVTNIRFDFTGSFSPDGLLTPTPFVELQLKMRVK